MQRRGPGADGGVDLAEAFSLPLAFRVIYEMLGIPFEVRAAVREVEGSWA